MKFIYALILPLFLTLSTYGASFPYITLSGTTNRIADNGSALTRNGSAIAGGGGTAGTVINTGASTTSKFPQYTDTTGTNVAPHTIVAADIPTLAPIASPTFTGTATIPTASIATATIGDATVTNLLSAGSASISSLVIGSMGIGTRSVLTETAGSIVCDLSLTNRYWSCSPTGNVTVAIINPTAGNWGNLLLRWPSTNCLFTLAWSSSSSTTNWLSGVPSTNATANTIGFLGIYPQDSTTNSTIAGYSATQ